MKERSFDVTEDVKKNVQSLLPGQFRGWNWRKPTRLMGNAVGILGVDNCVLVGYACVPGLSLQRPAKRNHFTRPR